MAARGYDVDPAGIRRPGATPDSDWRMPDYDDETKEFVPLEKQAAFMASTAPEKLLSGAYGAGKSRVGCELGLFLSLRYAGNVGLIVRKKFSTMRHTTLKTLLEKVIPPQLILAHNESKKQILLDTGTDAEGNPRQPSEIFYMGMDDPLKVGSMELAWFFYDELIEARSEDEWTMLVGRLRHPFVPVRQGFAATNPGAPAHWAYRYFIKPGASDRFVVQTTTFDNEKHLPPDYIRRVRRFTGVHLQRYGYGKWVGYEGLVYNEFDPATHVVDDFEVPKAWPRWRSIDYGTSHPFVCQWWTRNPATQQLVMYREIYMTQRRVEAHAADIKKSSVAERFNRTFADHDAGANLTMTHHGIPTTKATKTVAAGIQAVKERLQVSPITGEPGIVFMRGALIELDPALEVAVMEPGKGNAQRLPTCTTDEFGAYAWARNNNGVKDEPADGNDHGMDAMRYLVMGIESPAKRTVSSG